MLVNYEKTILESSQKKNLTQTIFDLLALKKHIMSFKVNSWSNPTTNNNVPSEKLVKDSLNLKADVNPTIGKFSALQSLFISRGLGACSYSAETDTYLLNGIAHTEAEISEAFNATASLPWGSYLRGACEGLGIKTNFPPLIPFTSGTKGNYAFMFKGCTDLEVLNFSEVSESASLTGVDFTSFVEGCSSLVNCGYLDFVELATTQADIFKGCVSLETVFIKTLANDLSFADSPEISLESLTYLVTNANNSGNTISVTVHADVYTKLTDVEEVEWKSLFDSAALSNIDFVAAQ